MTKKIFWQGLVAGLLAALAAVVYNRIYFFATEPLSQTGRQGTLVGINLLACLVAAFGFWLLTKWSARKGEIIFNFLFSILSFASIILPISVSLPLDIQNPELFPGLTIPMHFFPALAWFTIRPVFS